MRALILIVYVLSILPRVADAAALIPIHEKALGRSLAGGHTLNDSLYSNPAGPGFTSVYSIDGSYFGGGGFSASVLDTKTSSMGGGLGYFRLPAARDGKLNQGVNLGLMGRITPMLAWGINGKLMWGENDVAVKKNLKDMDIGLLLNMQMLQIGGVLRNVFGGDEDYLDEARELGIGARINYAQVIFLSAAVYTRFDQITPHDIGLGFEYLSPYYFSLRAGYRLLPRDGRSYWGLGAGISSGKFGVHYAAEIPNQSGPVEHALNLNLML